MKSVDKSEIQISEQAEICTSDQIYKEQGWIQLLLKFVLFFVMWFKEKCSSLFCTNSKLQSLFWWQITTGTINLWIRMFYRMKNCCFCFVYVWKYCPHDSECRTERLQARWAETRKSCVHSMCSCREDVGFSLHFLSTTGHAHNDLW